MKWAEALGADAAIGEQLTIAQTMLDAAQALDCGKAVWLRDRTFRSSHFHASFSHLPTVVSCDVG